MIKVLPKKTFRIISSFLVVCIFTLTMFNCFGTSNVVQAKTIAELEREQAELQKKEKEISNQLNNTTAKIKDEKKTQALLDSQIKSVEGQIVLYQDKINIVNDNITKKEAEIKAKLDEIEVNEEMFAQRVKAMYITSTSSSILSTLLESKSFAQFLNNKEIISRISSSDKDLIDKLASDKEELNIKKIELEKQQSDLKSTKQSFEAKNKSLDHLYDQSKSSESQLKKVEKQYYLDKQKYAKEIKNIEAEVDRIIAASKNDGSGPQGQLAWPVPASSRITSKFGWRTIWGKRDWHLGIDIGAGRGTAIVAAEAGEVILVRKSNYGYGWHVVINHGGGYSTLYAHASRIDVSVGQKVKRGQTIAGVGTTGNSTGNHLHFEVRVNNKQQNPINYVRKP